MSSMHYKYQAVLILPIDIYIIVLGFHYHRRIHINNYSEYDSAVLSQKCPMSICKSNSVTNIGDISKLESVV